VDANGDRAAGGIRNAVAAVDGQQRCDGHGGVQGNAGARHGGGIGGDDGVVAGRLDAATGAGTGVPAQFHDARLRDTAACPAAVRSRTRAADRPLAGAVQVDITAGGAAARSCAVPTAVVRAATWSFVRAAARSFVRAAARSAAASESGAWAKSGASTHGRESAAPKHCRERRQGGGGSPSAGGAGSG